MKIFITGISGLIGKWFAERALKEGHQVCGIDNRKITTHDHLNKYHVLADILDYERASEIIGKFQPDALVHLAARIDLDGTNLQDYDANITGVRNICKIVRETTSITRAIYTSSQLVCKVGYVPEGDIDYCPNTYYGESKVRTEQIVREEDGGGASWCLVRPTTVWGPYMSAHYERLLRHVKNGTYFHSGRGKLFKSYSYAGNIAFQYMRLLEAKKHSVQGKVFYMADYEPLSLRDYIDGLACEIGSRSPVTVPLPFAKGLALAGDVLNSIGISFPFTSFRLRNILTEYIFDMSLTEEVCGPLPYTFEEGVKATAMWFLSKDKAATDY